MLYRRAERLGGPLSCNLLALKRLVVLLLNGLPFCSNQDAMLPSERVTILPPSKRFPLRLITGCRFSCRRATVMPLTGWPLSLCMGYRFSIRATTEIDSTVWLFFFSEWQGSLTQNRRNVLVLQYCNPFFVYFSHFFLSGCIFSFLLKIISFLP